ncbi:bidirectional sugar transporter SWEET2a-like [Macadamia integrifolia]|uniref:bidirectional sugar transporter SWEET2a-like n=1 Tax=Macadamia integrifolia TaxID=60698 RepID=UPI001C4E2EB2|nr:bidirectional sugar transporter SWEET2a-like [Macadamia integrifolia]
MISSGLVSTYSFFSYGAGIAGNVFAFVLFLSPIPTFRRITRNRSTEEFSGLPYIYALMNCLICLWYGMPIVTPGIILVATVNSIGAVFQLTYIFIFILYAEKKKKMKMLGLLLAVLSIFALIVYMSLSVLGSPMRQIFVGYLSVASLISMFASPLFIVNLVIRTKSVEFMPFYLSLSTFLMSISFFAYGMLKCDAFIYVPNGIGSVLGAVQLVLYCYYSKTSREDLRESLITSFA